MLKVLRAASSRAVALLFFAPALWLSPMKVWAVDTHVWEQSDPAEFARGTTQRLSIRSDGHLTLAPSFQELDSTTVPYLWAIAQDSKGTLYYAGGAPTGTSTKIFALAPGGKPHAFAELNGLEIHALAVDSEDRIYAAVLPDAKIYRIDRSGKAELFFDPHCKYIWAMVFDRSGNLFAATGDSGLIYKIAPDGKGTQFANTNETHARSMILDSAGNLIVGTEPGGLVLRVSPQGETFVLFQTRKREVTAVAEHDGILYAAAVGSKPAVVTGAAPVLPTTAPLTTAAGSTRAATTPPGPAPVVGSLTATVTGGSDLYRIQKDGDAERLWDSASDIVYAVAFDSQGHPLLATGNKGMIYRIDSPQLSTQLLNAAPTQVTAFLNGRNGAIYALTGNVGNLYSIGPSTEKTGKLESEVLDAGEFSQWGKVHTTASSNGGSVLIESRSGNLSNPQHDWSPWTPVPASPLGGQIASPAARFLQYRLTLSSPASAPSPEVSAIDIPYLPRNATPRVDEIDIAPINYKQATTAALLERSVEPSGSPTSISVPAIGQRRSTSTPALSEAAGAATLQYSKGFVTIRWGASDSNHDTLSYKVELRPKASAAWRTLKADLLDTHYAFDSAAFPDGEYIARITASDAPANPPSEALTSSLESDVFTIDNTPPEIVGLESAKSGVHFTAKDAWSWIAKVEFSVDGGDWTPVDPVNRVTDSQELSYEVKARTGQNLAVRVFDDNDNVAVRQITVR